MISVSILMLGLLGCDSEPAAPAYSLKSLEGAKVVVLINDKSEASKEIGKYYAEKRGLPAVNVIKISCSPSEMVTMSEYKSAIESPVRDRIMETGRAIDYIVTTKGVPIKIEGQQYSVDAFLATMGLGISEIKKLDSASIRASMSPYFGKEESFSNAKFNMYLVTRLDGYTVADARGLVDRGLTQKADLGPFILDAAMNRRDSTYGQLQGTFAPAAAALNVRKFQTVYEDSAEFYGDTKPLMGYVSWGSNDSAFRAEKYHSLRFKPGAIAETFVSTSARTLLPTTGGQSLVADLVSQGVTGVKGYVSEPYVFAMARPDILFDRYTKGYNLAESFYMASPIARWKDVVLGDPLCRPYPKIK